MKTVRSEQHRLHFPKGELYGGQLVRPFECPERWDYVIEQLQARGYKEFVDPIAFDIELAQRVHAPDFLEFLASAWDEWQAEGMQGDAIPTCFPARRMHNDRVPNHIDGKLGYYSMAIETAIMSGTWKATQSAAACAITAQKFVSEDGVSFALCRPPGHHAGINMFGGYCFLNNAAIAAQGFIEDGAKRVAMLDVDFHHGNGSQDIFYQRDDVMYLSLHGRPEDAFPHFLGYEDERGAGQGEGYNVNYPLPPGTKFDVWFSALQDACRRISAYAPDALVVSLGVDTFESDPISFFKLTSDDFTHYGEALGQLKLPTLFVMEGGYAVSEIGLNTVNVLDGFLAACK